MTVKTPNILLMRRLLPILLGALVLFSFAGEAQGATRYTLKFIGDFEGFYPKPYNDPAGFATVGYGHLIADRPVNKSDRRRIWVKGQERRGQLTKSEGLRLLRKDLKGYEESIFDRIGNAPVSPLMMTALTSFTFNLGPGYLDFKPKVKRFGLGATNIAKNVRRGKYRRAAKQMRQYDGVVSGGNRYVLPGLTRRRTAEYRLMIKGIAQLENCGKSCGPSDDGDSGGIGTP